MPDERIPQALTIAGSDSGGGAGIQADLKTFAIHCVHGASALTCVTAQNTTGVTRVDALPVDSVIAQIDAVLQDYDLGAIKTGMLLNEEIISAVCGRLSGAAVSSLVIDPVMVSRSGDKLIDEAAIHVLSHRLLPLASLVTPNLYEAELLVGSEIRDLDSMRDAAHRILDMGAKSVLITGGAGKGDLRAVDWWCDGDKSLPLVGEVTQTQNTNGSGCTLSAAIAANLARGLAMQNAVKQAKMYVTRALQASLAIGRGNGPLGHFFPLHNLADDPSSTN